MILVYRVQMKVVILLTELILVLVVKSETLLTHKGRTLLLVEVSQ